MSEPSAFQQLLQAAAAQPDPQRLLFVFAAAGLPDEATPEQRARFEAGEGGSLTPLACVDRRLDELTDFAGLVEDARTACPPWDLVFVAGLSGQGGQQPTHAQVDAAIAAMVEGVRTGRLDAYLALDLAGEAVSFHWQPAGHASGSAAASASAAAS